ncbi:response regulator transcription factor [Stappia taiwanensis]|uniref:Response regulator transcription factor n=1 Tax=Stappia taiwanensis TaxID=992267 RepID=A0A838XT78_9HYPH|nr:response regulator transcription factor [Stappia taiwanensis]GGE97108.1 LuxR family transcriptional regulator [Stappia taiwanensis]
MDAQYLNQNQKDVEAQLEAVSSFCSASAEEQAAPISGGEARDCALLIDRRALDRDCLARSLSEHDPSLNIVPVSSVDHWEGLDSDDTPSVIVLAIGGGSTYDATVRAHITSVVERFSDCPVVVIADTEDLCQMLKAIECGARGFIPSSVGIGVAAEAIALARAGGVFLPASNVLPMLEMIESAAKSASGPGDIFTPREAEVAEALRRGKANKIIAYELHLCQSTVKVHVRNIMKKLNATNRTEVAYKLLELMQ